ncbi:MAG: BamA/TamA family outer membrane protein [Reichenbachiella sp.]
MIKKLALTCFILLLIFPSFAQEKKVSWAAVPSPSYNEVQGFGLALTGGLFYSMNAEDTTLQSSSTFIHGFYAENETWIGALLQEVYFQENNYWFDFLGVISRFNFQYYQEFPNLPIEGVNIGYSTDIQIAKFNFLRRIKGPLYGGIHLKVSNFDTNFDLNIPGLPGDGSGIVDLGSNNSRYVGLGVKTAYDTRDNPLNAKSGLFTDLIFAFFNDAYGSATNFTLMEYSLNYYHSFTPKHVLASRLYAKVGFNDVPFEEQPILGFAGSKGQDVRGYTSGRYRANQLYDVQGEWRWNVYKRWGTVLFGSLALVGDDFDQMKGNSILPALGGGIRFLVEPIRGVNIGLDYARGKDDYGVYFAITEAF